MKVSTLTLAAAFVIPLIALPTAKVVNPYQKEIDAADPHAVLGDISKRFKNRDLSTQQLGNLFEITNLGREGSVEKREQIMGQLGKSSASAVTKGGLSPDQLVSLVIPFVIADTVNNDVFGTQKRGEMETDEYNVVVGAVEKREEMETDFYSVAGDKLNDRAIATLKQFEVTETK